jgi:hypothetical protein
MEIKEEETDQTSDFKKTATDIIDIVGEIIGVADSPATLCLLVLY